MRSVLFAVLVLSFSAFWGSQVHAKRLALVIGNDKYENVTPLQKAVNDARAIGQTLEDLGFEVTALENLSRRQMNRKLQEFAEKIEKGDEALFFYAGHGIEIVDRNYLLPIDIPDSRPGQEAFVKSEAIAVDHVINTFKQRGARVSILILDACRDNPFPMRGTRGIGRSAGLGRTAAPEGFFVMYSAGIGQLALDELNSSDQNPNSVFTRTLVPLLQKPGLSLTETARQVRRDVRKLAALVPYNQRPAYYDELIGDFFFKPGVSAQQSRLQVPDTTNYQNVHTVTPAKRLPFEPEMVRIPGGIFRGEKGHNDRVQKIYPFEIGKYEVTFAEWDACVADGGCKYRPNDMGWGRGRRPVIHVRIYDIIREYIPWLNRKTGKAYRLPTEAEWLFSAQAGTQIRYPYGEQDPKACDYGNAADRKTRFKGRNKRCSDGFSDRTAPVGSFRPNGFGLYDMIGNVRERLFFCSIPNRIHTPANGEFWKNWCKKGQFFPVFLGESWKSRFKFRARHGGGSQSDVGFRLARSLPDATVANSDKYVIQVAAKYSYKEAQVTHEKLNTNHPKIFRGLQPVIQEVYVPHRKVIMYRVRFHGLRDKNSAKAVCKRLKSAGQSCLVIPTKQDQAKTSDHQMISRKQAREKTSSSGQEKQDWDATLKNMSYHDARKIILRNGWKPFPHRSLDEKGIIAREFYKLGYVEVEDCAGTGLGPCNFYFQNAHGRYLRIGTEGGDQPQVVYASVVNRIE